MYSYIKGKVTDIESSFVVLENNGIGFTIYSSNPYLYKINDEITMYIYQHVREDENTLYGFQNKEEKNLFLKLISVKGLGPRTALPMFSLGSISSIAEAIDNGNVLYLKKFPKIGDKVAQQIILDLKGKIDITFKNQEGNEELKEVLKSLGYKNSDILRVVKQIDCNDTIESQIKNALKLLLK